MFSVIRYQFKGVWEYSIHAKCETDICLANKARDNRYSRISVVSEHNTIEQARIHLKRLRYGYECTLDGEPAKVAGFQLDYAVVISHSKAIEFSWNTVDRIMHSTKAFRS